MATLIEAPSFGKTGTFQFKTRLAKFHKTLDEMARERIIRYCF
jgi:hypothetical protein